MKINVCQNAIQHSKVAKWKVTCWYFLKLTKSKHEMWQINVIPIVSVFKSIIKPLLYIYYTDRDNDDKPLVLLHA